MRSLDSSRFSREEEGVEVDFAVSLLSRPQSQSMETPRAFAKAQRDSALGVVLALRCSDMDTCLILDNFDNAFWVRELFFMALESREEKFDRAIFFSRITIGKRYSFSVTAKQVTLEARLQ